jgi:hypothetical protein
METLFVRLAFQKYVAQKTFPQFKFEAYIDGRQNQKKQVLTD